jgi:hypothetical protein
MDDGYVVYYRINARHLPIETARRALEALRSRGGGSSAVSGVNGRGNYFVGFAVRQTGEAFAAFLEENRVPTQELTQLPGGQQLRPRSSKQSGVPPRNTKVSSLEELVELLRTNRFGEDGRH